MELGGFSMLVVNFASVHRTHRTLGPSVYMRRIFVLWYDDPMLGFAHSATIDITADLVLHYTTCSTTHDVAGMQKALALRDLSARLCQSSLSGHFVFLPIR